MNLQMWTEFDVNQILNRTKLEMDPNSINLELGVQFILQICKVHSKFALNLICDLHVNYAFSFVCDLI